LRDDRHLLATLRDIDSDGNSAGIDRHVADDGSLIVTSLWLEALGEHPGLRTDIDRERHHRHTLDRGFGTDHGHLGDRSPDVIDLAVTADCANDLRLQRQGSTYPVLDSDLVIRGWDIDAPDVIDIQNLDRHHVH